MLGRYLERHLLVWLVVLSGVALFWTHISAHVGFHFDPFLETARYTKGLFAVTMFFIGWLLPRDELQQVVRQWPNVLGGTCIQYASMPLLAVGWSHALGLHDDWLWGSILVGCVPGAMASNVLTLAARGNVSYSLSGYLAGTVGARLLRLDASMRRALTLEIGMQNAGLGTVLATGTLFPDHPGAAVPPALYTFGCMFTGTALARWWARERRE